MGQTLQVGHTTPPAGADGGARIGRPGQVALGLVRLLFGWVFLWAFLDKAFGLGFSTPGERAWIAGSSPTTGYLGNLDGRFAGMFEPMSGNAVIDWLFMLGLLGVGIAFLLGVALRPLAIVGVLLMGGIYLTRLPLKDNPFLDQHLMYVVLGVALALTEAGRFLGLGRWWSTFGPVQNHRWLR